MSAPHARGADRSREHEEHDLDADAFDDVVVGAYSWDGPAGTDQGYVEAYSGASGSRLFRLEGVKLTDTFGASLAIRHPQRGPTTA